MRVWLPHLRTGGGGERHAQRLGRGLSELGHQVALTPLAPLLQYCPWFAGWHREPPGCDITVTDTPIGFALRRRGSRLVTVEHHAVLDSALRPYRSALQKTIDRSVTFGLVKRSLERSDAVVVHSKHAARSLAQVYGFDDAVVIYPGIDTDYFRPPARPRERPPGQPFRLLWVGNMIRRKGADLLPEILGRLGSGYELRYTSGLRTSVRFHRTARTVALGRLTLRELRDEYQQADLLLFPTRFEGFGYVVAEALACGLPVVTTDTSSLPELVEDGATGRLCAIDDAGSYAAAIEELAAAPERHEAMRKKARTAAAERFALSRMAAEYEALLIALL